MQQFRRLLCIINTYRVKRCNVFAPLEVPLQDLTKQSLRSAYYRQQLSYLGSKLRLVLRGANNSVLWRRQESLLDISKSRHDTKS